MNAAGNQAETPLAEEQSSPSLLSAVDLALHTRSSHDTNAVDTAVAELVTSAPSQTTRVAPPLTFNKRSQQQGADPTSPCSF